jgi:hypothetical protein
MPQKNSLAIRVHECLVEIERRQRRLSLLRIFISIAVFARENSGLFLA